MPYITKDAACDPTEWDGSARNPRNPGELNYKLSTVLADYVSDQGLSYSTLNDISGAMTEALAEFRRRIVVPYEDIKRAHGVDPYEQIRPSDETPMVRLSDPAWTVKLRKGTV